MVGAPQNVKEMTVNTIQLLDKKQSLDDIAAKRKKEGEEQKKPLVPPDEAVRRPSAVQREELLMTKPSKESPKHSQSS